jgi:transcriptional regulator with XRE-family HTH domain
MKITQSSDEIEAQLGQQMRSLRLRRNLDQQTLASKADVGLSALKNIESGKGSTVRTLVRVLRALDRLDWLATLAPAVSISPLQLLQKKPLRQRASAPRSRAG